MNPRTPFRMFKSYFKLTMKFIGQPLALTRTLILLSFVAVAMSYSAPASAQLVCKQKTTGYFKLVLAAPAASIKLGGMETPLTSALGDSVRGVQIAAAEDKGNCLACHKIPQLSDQPDHGNLGPALDGVGLRYNEAQLRQMIVDPSAFFPATIMPRYHKTEGYSRIAAQFDGKTVLSAQEVEDVVAFLKTLR